MPSAPGQVKVRAAESADLEFVRETLEASWGPGGKVAGRGVLHDPNVLPALIAEVDGTPVGLLTYRDDGDAREVVTVNAVRRGAGVGAALLDAVEREARAHGIRRLWLVTTNDNTPALRSYQRAGWDLVALHRNAVAADRALKPTIPHTGEDGIPIRHELELERWL